MTDNQVHEAPIFCISKIAKRGVQQCTSFFVCIFVSEYRDWITPSFDGRGADAGLIVKADKLLVKVLNEFGGKRK